MARCISDYEVVVNQVRVQGCLATCSYPCTVRLKPTGSSRCMRIEMLTIPRAYRSVFLTFAWTLATNGGRVLSAYSVLFVKKINFDFGKVSLARRFLYLVFLSADCILYHQSSLLFNADKPK